MNDIDLTEAVEAGIRALVADGLAEHDGPDGYVIENVYAHAAVHVALTAVLPAIREQLAREVESMESMYSPIGPGDWRHLVDRENAARIVRGDS